MPIFFRIEAQSLEELRLAVCKALDLKMHTTGPGVVYPPEREQGDYIPDSVKDMAGEPEQDNFQPPYDHTAKTKVDPKRRAHRATKNGNAKPMPVDAPGEETDVPLTVPEPEDEPEVEVEEEEPGPDEASMLDPVAAEALKKSVIDQLAGLFSAGKVKVVRHVLDKYGKGAKSFPEIDASQFPAIRDAIARGETA